MVVGNPPTDFLGSDGWYVRSFNATKKILPTRVDSPTRARKCASIFDRESDSQRLAISSVAYHLNATTDEAIEAPARDRRQVEIGMTEHVVRVWDKPHTVKAKARPQALARSGALQRQLSPPRHRNARLDG